MTPDRHRQPWGQSSRIASSDSKSLNHQIRFSFGRNLALERLRNE